MWCSDHDKWQAIFLTLGMDSDVLLYKCHCKNEHPSHNPSLVTLLHQVEYPLSKMPRNRSVNHFGGFWLLKCLRTLYLAEHPQSKYLESKTLPKCKTLGASCQHTQSLG